MKKYIYLTIGCLAMACAVNFVVAPNEIIAGGISGLAVVLNYKFGLNKDIIVWAVNVFLMIYAFFFISKKFAMNSFIGSIILFPLFLFIIPEMKIIENDFVAAVIGGVLAGIGVFFLYLSNGSTGGTTIVGMIIHQVFNTKYAMSVAIADGVIVLIGFLVFGLENTIYALVNITVMTITAEYLESGFKRVKVVHILTSEIDVAANELRELFPNLKLISLNYNDNIIIALTKANQIQKIREFVSERNLAMYTTTATSTYGEFFSIFENAGK